MYWKIENNTKDTLERRCQNVNITFLLEVISEPRFLAPTLPTPTREHPHYISSNSRHISTFLHLPIIYIPIKDIFLHLTLTNYFSPKPDTSTFLHFPIIYVSILGKFLPFYTSLNSTFQDFLLFNCFSPEADTCLHFCNCFCLNSIQKYTLHNVFSLQFFLSKLSLPPGILTARG